MKGRLSVEEALTKRRSIREYEKTFLKVEDISQLLWSAYGISGTQGLRTAPSARELYPLRIDLAAQRVETLEPGLYHYDPVGHQLKQSYRGGMLEKLYQATYNQTAVQQASAVVVFSADYKRPLEEFGDAGRRYVDLDLGHAAENLHLQAVSLEVGTVVIAAFRPEEVDQILSFPDGQKSLYLMPLGYPLQERESS
jgi:SagB-type dehydrogenase family enzyme